MWMLRKYCWKLGTGWHWALFQGTGSARAVGEGQAKTEEDGAAADERGDRGPGGGQRGAATRFLNGLLTA